MAMHPRAWASATRGSVSPAPWVTPNRVDALVRETGIFTQDRWIHRPRDDPQWIDSLTAALTWRAREGRWPRQSGDADEVRLGTWINTQRGAARNGTISGHREGLLRAVALIA